MAQDWKKVHDDAQAEIEQLEIDRERIEKRIEQLKRIKLAAQPLSQPDSSGLWDAVTSEMEAAGITEACRQVMREASVLGKFMSPLEVRAALEKRGLDLSKQKNAMASVHAVLKRLREKDEVIARTAADGGTVYKGRARLATIVRRYRMSHPPTQSGQPPVAPSPPGSLPVKPPGAVKTLADKINEEVMKEKK